MFDSNFIFRLLDDMDPEVQSKVLDCLLNWKEEFMTPYAQNLRNLAVSKNLREELTTWSVSKESNSIEEEHRSHLVPLIIRLLTPKIRNLKSLGSRKVVFFYCFYNIFLIEICKRGSSSKF